MPSPIQLPHWFFLLFLIVTKYIHSMKNTTLAILKLTGIKQLLSWGNHHTVTLWNYFHLILVKLCPLNTNLPHPWFHHSICLYESCCSISDKCNHIVFFFSLNTMLSRFTHVWGLFQNFLLFFQINILLYRNSIFVFQFTCEWTFGLAPCGQWCCDRRWIWWFMLLPFQESRITWETNH